MADELININVIIADRPYRLKIKPDEEEQVRKAAKLINDKLREFQNTYEAKDKQDYLAMCALTYAVDVSNFKNKTVINDNSFSDKLEEMDQMISGYLTKNEPS